MGFGLAEFPRKVAEISQEFCRNLNCSVSEFVSKFFAWLEFKVIHDFLRQAEVIENYDELEVLPKINCPTYILHVAAPKETSPSYYDEDRILLSAMDEQDAKKVNELIKSSKLIEGFQSMHDIHSDCPKEFIETMIEFKSLIKQ